MIEKKIKIDGKDVKLRCSALLPRIYRAKFGRDMITDMRSLAKAYKEAKEKGAEEIDLGSLEVFENIAWLMQRQAGEDVGESPEEWLDNMDGIFSVYEALPSILELWKLSNRTTSVPRKK